MSGAPQSSGPFVVDPNQGLYLGAALGVVGGLFIGKYAYQHLFVDGLTGEERKNMLLFAAGMGLLWGIAQLDLGEYGQWIDPLHIFLPDESQKAGTP